MNRNQNIERVLKQAIGILIIIITCSLSLATVVHIFQGFGFVSAYYFGMVCLTTLLVVINILNFAIKLIFE